MTKISALYNFSKTYGVNLNSEHWLLTKNLPKNNRQKYKILHDLIEELDLNSGLYFKTKRLCWCKDCFNPFHHDLIIPDRIPIKIREEIQNLKELAEDIDLEKVTEMGLIDYLNYFNGIQLSDLLKIDMKTLKKVIDYKSKFNSQKIVDNKISM